MLTLANHQLETRPKFLHDYVVSVCFGYDAVSYNFREAFESFRSNNIE